MTRRYRKLAVLAKIETTYGIDPAPTSVADAMLMTDVTIGPMRGTDVPRDLMLPWLGGQGVNLTQNYGTLRGMVEIAGSGTAGVIPAYAPLLRACGLSETVVMDPNTNRPVRVEYRPVSSGYESVTLFYFADGVRHVLLGARGTFTMEFSPRDIPRFTFDFMGILGQVSDVAPPTSYNVGRFRRAQSVTARTTRFSILGAQRPTERLTFDLGHQVEMRHLMGSTSAVIVGRNTTGQAVVDARPMADGDWFDDAESRTRSIMALNHGQGAGNLFAINGGRVEIGRPEQGQSQGILTYTLPMYFTPGPSGNDDVAFLIA